MPPRRLDWEPTSLDLPTPSWRRRQKARKRYAACSTALLGSFGSPCSAPAPPISPPLKSAPQSKSDDGEDQALRQPHRPAAGDERRPRPRPGTPLSAGGLQPERLADGDGPVPPRPAKVRRPAREAASGQSRVADL